MTKLIKLAGMSAGGWLGWAIGRPASFFTAFVLSVVGTGLGLYVADRIGARLLE